MVFYAWDIEPNSFDDVAAIVYGAFLLYVLFYEFPERFPG